MIYCGLLHNLRAQNKAERLSPVDRGISRGVTDLHPSPEYTHTPHNTRDRGSIARSLQRKLGFDQKPF